MASKIKTFFWGVIFLSCSQLNAQFTSIPDPQFENYLENNGMGDGISNNGLVLTANIENVTQLILNAHNITSLQGIEDFQALEHFSCSNNPITQVDLIQNTNLKLLGFVNTLLTTLDITSLENLEWLHLNLNLHLTTVELGNKPHLTIIEAFENRLTSIDLSECPELVSLYIQNNQLSQLDISHNQKLFVLWHSVNPLQELNTSNNHELGVLNGGYTNITHYDFSQNPNLYMFSDGYNNALTYIDVRNGHNEIIEVFNANYLNDNLKCVYVDDASAPYLENWTINPNAHFVENEQECDALNILEVEDEMLIFYPNPVKEKLWIQNPAKIINEILIFDSNGKLIQSEKQNSTLWEINLKNLPSGTYFVLVKTKEEIISKKILKL